MEKVDLLLASIKKKGEDKVTIYVVIETEVDTEGGPGDDFRSLHGAFWTEEEAQAHRATTESDGPISYYNGVVEISADGSMEDKANAGLTLEHIARKIDLS